MSKRSDAYSIYDVRGRLNSIGGWGIVARVPGSHHEQDIELVGQTIECHGKEVDFEVVNWHVGTKTQDVYVYVPVLSITTVISIHSESSIEVKIDPMLRRDWEDAEGFHVKRWLLKGLPRRDRAVQNGAAHSGPMFNALEILRLPREVYCRNPWS